jgi:ubiquinone/menaquinone biosynthesis C-methylase UbiE
VEVATAVSLINANIFKPNTVEHWADLGAGSGLFTYALSTLLSSGSSIIAVDHNQKALKRIKVHEGIELKIVAADFVNDNLPLNELSGVLMANALHFVKNKNDFLQRIKRYLKANASFLVVEYNTSTANMWVPYPLTIGEYERLFAEEGFNRFEVINKTPSRFRRADIVSMVVNN